MIKTALPLLTAAFILSVVVAVAQPPPLIPLPLEPGLTPASPEIGLLEAARGRLSAMGLMVLGRELSREEQGQIALARDVADLLGIERRNFIGPLSELAQRPGILQESIRALRRGEYQQAQAGLWYAVCLLPDAKIVHRELAAAYLQLDELDKARGHWSVSVGYIPTEDDVFVGLVRLSATDEQLAQSQLPEKMPVSQLEMPSLATIARVCAVLYLVDKPGVVEGLWETVPQEHVQNAPYVDLAAATVAELTVAAVEVMFDGDEFDRRQEAKEALLLAAIGACDGRWVEDCLRGLTSAKNMVNDDSVTRLIALAEGIVRSVISGEALPEDVAKAAEELLDLRLLQVLAERQ